VATHLRGAAFEIAPDDRTISVIRLATTKIGMPAHSLSWGPATGQACTCFFHRLGPGTGPRASAVDRRYHRRRGRWENLRNLHGGLAIPAKWAARGTVLGGRRAAQDAGPTAFVIAKEAFPAGRAEPGRIRAKKSLRATSSMHSGQTCSSHRGSSTSSKNGRAPARYQGGVPAS